MSSSPLSGLFEAAKGHFERFRQDIAAYGLQVGSEVELRDGQGLLCYYDLSDGHIHLSLPDPADPVGVFQAAIFRSILACESDAELAELVRLLLPSLIAHEMGHLLRHRRGLFGNDLWFEEQVANQFASALAHPLLLPAQRATLVRMMRRTLAHLAPKVGSPEIATASYLDPLQALGASGILAPEKVRSLELMDRLLSLSPERVLREMPQPSAEVVANFAQRDGTIEQFNEEYSSGLARYVYFQFGWMLIHLESREHHYIDEVGREHLGQDSAVLPRIPHQAEPDTAHIRSCFRAHQSLAVKAPAVARYFYKRYRAQLLDKVAAEQTQKPGSGHLMDDAARRFLESQDEEDESTLDFLSVAVPAELKLLFPSALAASASGVAALCFACETDERLWQHIAAASADAAAATTSNRLKQLESSEIYRTLPAELLVELTHVMYRIHVPAGQVMIHQGSTNDDVFIVVKGAFDVMFNEPDGERKISAVHAGEVAGDMAFLTGEPRTASMIATQASECMVLRAAALKLLAFENPTVLMRMARVLIRRLGPIRVASTQAFDQQ